MILLTQWWRRQRRRLGLAIYGKPGSGTIALVRGWPPDRPEIEPRDEEVQFARFVAKQPPLTAEEQRLWEHLGVHVYEENQ